MKKSALEIYALVVCFAAIGCGAIALGVGVYDLIGIFKPEITLQTHQYEKHQNNEAFIRMNDYDTRNELKNMTEEDLTTRRRESYQVAINMERRNDIQSLMRVLIILAIDALLFVIHWNIARRERDKMFAT